MKVRVQPSKTLFCVFAEHGVLRLLAALVALKLGVRSDGYGQSQLLQLHALLLGQRLPNARNSGLLGAVGFPSDVVSLPAGQVLAHACEAIRDVLEGVDVVIVEEHSPPLLLVKLLFHLCLPVSPLDHSNACIRQVRLHLRTPQRLCCSSSGASRGRSAEGHDDSKASHHGRRCLAAAAAATAAAATAAAGRFEGRPPKRRHAPLRRRRCHESCSRRRGCNCGSKRCEHEGNGSGQTPRWCPSGTGHR
mmetsp:Transcript_51483/g.130032  ORF Transcript_51483/g.130032 Transcript_51483/m.130032 type:complete len:248 (-) Transcript_51483:113-856(-)